MGCPHSLHGDARGCSLCLGATARIVTRSPSGALLVDGRPAGREFAHHVSGRPTTFLRGRRKRAVVVRTIDDDLDVDRDDE